MVKYINQNLIIKFLIICLCIIKITQSKKIEFTIKKTAVINGKKHHTIHNDPIKKINSEFPLENRKKNSEKKIDFKLKGNEEKVDKTKLVKVKAGNIVNKNIKESKVENKHEENSDNNLKNNIIISNEGKEDKNEGNNYYLYGGGVVSIALIGVGFLNVYQRNRNSIFNLTKEELEALDKNKKINNNYTSLSEEERRFLHKINKRKHNNMRRYDELTEDEILEIRKKNGWADSDDGEFQLRKRKIDNRLSCNVKINSTNVVAPRRISLNVKLDKDPLLSNNTDESCNSDKKLKRKSILPLDKNNLVKYTASQKALKLHSVGNTKKSLSINTKNPGMPPIKMICTIIKNYKPLRTDEIELHLGDKVEIVNIYKDGWASGKIVSNDNNNNNQKIGYFPLAHASEPEIFDEKINEMIIPSPLTPPISRKSNNLYYQNSPLVNSSSSNTFSKPNIEIVNSTLSTKTTKSKNRHVSMIAVSSSSSILTQKPLSNESNKLNSSVININNNINIINNNIDRNNNDIPKSININININDNDNNKCINNSISINNNENTPVFNSNNILVTSKTSSDNLKYRNRTPSILDSQNITNLLNDILEEENKQNNRITTSNSNSLPCHSQEVFDFLRGNVYNSSIALEEREYYKKCLERLRISKIIDMEINQTDKQKHQEKCE